MLSVFLGKRKINFKHLIATRVDVGRTRHGTNPVATVPTAWFTVTVFPQPSQENFWTTVQTTFINLRSEERGSSEGCVYSLPQNANKSTSTTDNIITEERWTFKIEPIYVKHVLRIWKVSLNTWHFVKTSHFGVTAEYPVTSKCLTRGVRIHGYEVAGTTPPLEIM